MYLALGIGVILTAVAFPQLAASAGPRFVIAMEGGVVIVIGLLIWLVARQRQNWARWTFLALYLVGLPFYVPRFPAMVRENAVTAAASACQLLFQAIAFYLVFSGDASGWFQPQAAEGGGAPGARPFGPKRAGKILLWIAVAAMALIVAAVALTYLSILIFGYNR
jgi:hypothetical protein